LENAVTRTSVKNAPGTGRTVWEKELNNNQHTELLKRVVHSLGKERIKVKLVERGMRGPGNPTGVWTKDFKPVLLNRLQAVTNWQKLEYVLVSLSRLELQFEAEQAGSETSRKRLERVVKMLQMLCSTGVWRESLMKVNREAQASPES